MANTQAFIVIIDMPDGVDPLTLVDELTDDLSDFDVVSIHPWASPMSAQAAPTPPPIQTT